MKSKAPIIAAIVAGVIALAAIGILIKQNLDFSAEREDYEYKMEDLSAEILDMEDNVKEIESELENKSMEVEEKDLLLAEREMELLNKQKKIDILLKNQKITKAEAAELRTRVDQLNFYLRKYRARVDSLTVVVGNLTAENQSLRTNLASAEEAVHKSDMELTLATTMLDAGAILIAEDFQFYRVKNKGQGKAVLESEINGNRLDVLRTCFRINANAYAKNGERTIYVVITDKNGNPVADESNQSGYFKHEGRDMVYSLKTTINFDRTSQQVCVNYTRPNGKEFTEGEHTVVAYCEGYDIGTGTFKIK